MIQAVEKAHRQGSERDMLTDYLATRDVECPLCHYNLRGLHGSHCPECGHELVLQVALTDPVRGAYLTGLIGLACGLGFNALIFTMWIVLTIALGPDPPLSTYIAPAVMTAVFTGLLITWVRHSALLRRQSRPRRFMFASIAWCLSVFSMAIFAYLLINGDI